LFIAADVHGHRAELRRALRAAGLTGSGGAWCGGTATLWLLGDYVDRGPDGIGVIDDLRTLARQAAGCGGLVGCLLGNHEVQLLGADRFGAAPIPGQPAPEGMLGLWRRWGGRDHDLARLTDDHRAWLRSLPAVALAGGYLLLHSDTVNYLGFGSSRATVNAGVAATMSSCDPAAWLELVFRLADRLSYLGPDADRAVGAVLDRLGGRRIVHGHSTLVSHFGVRPAETTRPVEYAGGRVIAVDGGAYQGGHVLVVELAVPPPADPASSAVIGCTAAGAAGPEAGRSSRPDRR
jgi:hypothetical protein